MSASSVKGKESRNCLTRYKMQCIDNNSDTELQSILLDTCQLGMDLLRCCRANVAGCPHLPVNVKMLCIQNNVQGIYYSELKQLSTCVLPHFLRILRLLLRYFLDQTYTYHYIDSTLASFTEFFSFDLEQMHNQTELCSSFAVLAIQLLPYDAIRIGQRNSFDVRNCVISHCAYLILPQPKLDAMVGHRPQTAAEHPQVLPKKKSRYELPPSEAPHPLLSTRLQLSRVARLPREMLVEVFQCLTPRYIVSVAATCRWWCAAVHSTCGLQSSLYAAREVGQIFHSFFVDDWGEKFLLVSSVERAIAELSRHKKVCRQELHCSSFLRWWVNTVLPPKSGWQGRVSGDTHPQAWASSLLAPVVAAQVDRKEETVVSDTLALMELLA